MHTDHNIIMIGVCMLLLCDDINDTECVYEVQSFVEAQQC
jgi:hypothetical protein